MKRFLFLLACPIGIPIWAVVKLIHFIVSKVTHHHISYVDSLEDGFAFERYVAGLLRQRGFRNVEVTRATGDYGVDIVAYYKKKKYGIQCKLYSYPVGNKAVQEIAAGLPYYDCDYGVVVTNHFFTAAAVNLAEANGILLWDREALIRLMHGDLKL